MTVEEWANASKGERFAYAASRHPLTIAFGYVTIFFFGMCVRSFLVSPKRHWDSAVTVLVHVALCIGFAMCGWDKLFLAMWLPISVASAAGSYLFYAQHNFPGVQYGGRDDWTYVTAALTSSSYIDTNPIMHWFTANIGYHHIHHLNHRIPFYRLPEAMEAMVELQSPTRTTLRPRDIAACLSLIHI